jgi:hypothetical protein
VRSQIAKRRGRAALRGAHRLEERDHAPGIDLRGQQHPQTLHISLALEMTAVSQRAEHARALDAVGHRARDISRHRDQQEPRRGVLHHEARGMPLEHVLELVGEHSGQLLGGARPLDETAEQYDLAAGNGERVHGRVVDDGHPKRVRRGGLG